MEPLKFDQNKLITAVAQDMNSKEILMVAMMNAEAFALTQRTKQAHFWSRSREELWLKGETSGNFLNVIEVWLDCDRDVVLLQVEPTGPVCHTGNLSCFFTKLEF
ncbi:MAG: phosphoribosyl-AMP cyclohydrolase [Chloroflexi bacterium]|nr:phosphoribosyl-AMP cyclohydrolase [Chloroflexota bacterium]